VTTDRHLGLDLGGTNLKVAVLERSDREGETPVLLASDTLPTHAERGPDGVVAVMVEAGLDAIATHGPVATIGIGVPGLFERETGVIRLFPNFPGPWTGYPLRARLEAGLGRPVALINDARAHTLAESRMGAGRGARTMALVTLGTGIGGGLIVDGKLHLGTGTGGEIGHQTVLENGPQCGCGNRGCAEALAQAKAITTAAGKTSVKAVFAGAAAGDERCVAAVDQAIRALGIAIANVVNVLAPDRVVVGGGMAAAGDVIMKPLRANVREHARMLPPERIDIVPAELGPLAGAIGAALAGAEGV
jgi:glucokinase